MSQVQIRHIEKIFMRDRHRLWCGGGERVKYQCNDKSLTHGYVKCICSNINTDYVVFYKDTLTVNKIVSYAITTCVSVMRGWYDVFILEH